MEALDCDLITEELCFWENSRYSISENTKPVRIGSLSSPFLVEMCASCKINYNLLSKNKEFRIVSNGALHSIESTEALDREIQSQHFLEVLCMVENSKQTLRNITKTLRVTVLDVDDNLPKPQEDIFKITVASMYIHKVSIFQIF